MTNRRRRALESSNQEEDNPRRILVTPNTEENNLKRRNSNVIFITNESFNLRSFFKFNYSLNFNRMIELTTENYEG